ncbi:hypothetical protein [Streptomyces sp. H27-D2]|uniref:hypothetical protein n=1 Tax=Streptomyces sp. H27-D2 TaxID=3046304 RepID=UPI002DB5DEA2|nr:hypothetical protein [Streptomyces sp. H27-D2]MEC4017150.1 hypothetical protein [Streptomyces sp. H27-D2]
MDLVLDPPRGVAPVRLGMTLDETVAALSVWGKPRVLSRPNQTLVNIGISLDRVRFQVLLEKVNCVTAIQLWWPGEGRESSTRVLLEGDDVFCTPARKIFRRAVARGWTVDQSEFDYPFIPGVSIGFTRQTAQEVPRYSDGSLMYLTSVLVGDEKYFDFHYKNND